MKSSHSESAPDATSPGNAGARGSRGQANSGAQPANSTNEGADARERVEGEPDLRDAKARGGGGVSSESSRSE